MEGSERVDARFREITVGRRHGGTYASQGNK